LEVTKGRGIDFRNGYPDFSPFEVKRHDFDNLQGTDRDRRVTANNWLAEQLKLPDASAADRWRRAQGLTWHHNENMVTLQLIPTVINDIPHMGGASLLRQIRGGN
jgi:hypothetical protein